MTPWNCGYIAFLNQYPLNPYTKDSDKYIEFERGYNAANRNDLMIKLTFNFWPKDTI